MKIFIKLSLILASLVLLNFSSFANNSNLGYSVIDCTDCSYSSMENTARNSGLDGIVVVVDYAKRTHRTFTVIQFTAEEFGFPMTYVYEIGSPEGFNEALELYFQAMDEIFYKGTEIQLPSGDEYPNSVMDILGNTSIEADYIASIQIYLEAALPRTFTIRQRLKQEMRSAFSKIKPLELTLVFPNGSKITVLVEDLSSIRLVYVDSTAEDSNGNPIESSVGNGGVGTIENIYSSGGITIREKCVRGITSSGPGGIPRVERICFYSRIHT